MSIQSGQIENLLSKDRAIVVLGLAALTVTSWLYLISLSRRMAMDMTMPMSLSWSTTDFTFTFVMWSVMMVGMMVPSAAPMILTFAMVNRKRAERNAAFVPTSMFLAGYLLAWTAFSLIATLVQWRLHAAAFLNPHTQAVTPLSGGLVLIAAGIFQLTPAKKACLKHCRSPLNFIASHWREGHRGALLMGLEHGAFCVGCCWMLMALLFVAGVMNLLWVAAIAAFVLVEKILPRGTLVTLTASGLLMSAGLVLLARVLWPW
jgi:predicted metal-binding membrane protein